jgi:hypothetical protein
MHCFACLTFLILLPPHMQHLPVLTQIDTLNLIYVSSKLLKLLCFSRQFCSCPRSYCRFFPAIIYIYIYIKSKIGFNGSINCIKLIYVSSKLLKLLCFSRQFCSCPCSYCCFFPCNYIYISNPKSVLTALLTV